MYREMLASPPPGVRYQDMLQVGYSDNPFEVRERRSQAVKNFIADLPLIGDIAAWGYHSSGRPMLPGDGDIAHLCNGWTPCFTKTGKPYVVDYESNIVFVDFSQQRLKMGFYRRMVEKHLAHSTCARVVSLTEFCKAGFENAFDVSGFTGKLVTSYPAMRNITFRPRRAGERVSLLFVGFTFQLKGGMEVLQAFEGLQQRYDVELHMISRVPLEVRERFAKTPHLHIYPFVPREKLYAEFFPRADVFVLPTYMEGLGFVFLEAMNFALPIVSTNHLHIPELVKDGVGGLLIKAPISGYDERHQISREVERFLLYSTPTFPDAAKELEEKLAVLIEDAEMRRRMGRANKREIQEGKFSVKRRGEQLRGFYEDALHG